MDRVTAIGNLLTSPPATATGNRRASVRQKRRSLREPNTAKDPSGSTKKKLRLDNGNVILTDNGAENITSTDPISTRSNSTDQQTMENPTGKTTKFLSANAFDSLIDFLAKRARPGGRRGGKRSVNQQGNVRKLSNEI